MKFTTAKARRRDTAGELHNVACRPQRANKVWDEGSAIERTVRLGLANFVVVNSKNEKKRAYSRFAMIVFHVKKNAAGSMTSPLPFEE
ncbi:hypothetical protein KIN20_006676 [Parelaphostrongylus tenuis]|uniref:Uncharacterized protein n=1 Tax=Parelaphostrongylus tenuis TaxID=148309 RepID=A0AAD5MND9_PARTN|nr:hypothetical protein KIN20_006676 [Parelaphostrongylus tenuis]